MALSSFAPGAEHVEAVVNGHVNVGDHELRIARRMALEALHGPKELAPVGRLGHLEAHHREGETERPALLGRVVGDEHAWWSPSVGCRSIERILSHGRPR